MVRRDQQQIFFFKQWHKFSELFVKPLDFLSVSDRISPVSPQGIKIDQIGKAQTAEIGLGQRNGLVHPMDTAGRMQTFCNSVSVKNIMDLSDCQHVISGFLKRI